MPRTPRPACFALALLLTTCTNTEFHGESGAVGFATNLGREHSVFHPAWTPGDPILADTNARFCTSNDRHYDGGFAFDGGGETSIVDGCLTLQATSDAGGTVSWSGGFTERLPDGGAGTLPASDHFDVRVGEAAGVVAFDPLLGPGGRGILAVSPQWLDPLPSRVRVFAGTTTVLLLLPIDTAGRPLGHDPRGLAAATGNEGVSVRVLNGYLFLTTPSTLAGTAARVSLSVGGVALREVTFEFVASSRVDRLEVTLASGGGAALAIAVDPSGARLLSPDVRWSLPAPWVTNPEPVDWCSFLFLDGVRPPECTLPDGGPDPTAFARSDVVTFALEDGGFVAPGTTVTLSAQSGNVTGSSEFTLEPDETTEDPPVPPEGCGCGGGVTLLPAAALLLRTRARADRSSRA